MLTQEQRENRALFNLARNEVLSRHQLYCASVNDLALRTLRQNGHVQARVDEVHFRDTGEIQMLADWELTRAGAAELERRIHDGIASTITHDERSHA